MSSPRPTTVPPPSVPIDIGHYIGGRAVAGTSGRKGRLFDPATGVQRGQVAYASEAETQAAIAAAAAALPAWAATPPLQRARVLFRFKSLLEQHFDELLFLFVSDRANQLAVRGSPTQRVFALFGNHGAARRTGEHYQSI